MLDGFPLQRRLIPEWTHAALVLRAARWLKNNQRCGVVLVEPQSFQAEIPDAIGWVRQSSFLIECKATRADFLSDAKKTFRRRPERGMGEFRYYMTPVGLIDKSELPDRWGLIEVHGRRSRVIVRAEARPREEALERQYHETLLMYYALYGVQHYGKTTMERSGLDAEALGESTRISTGA